MISNLEQIAEEMERDDYHDFQDSDDAAEVKRWAARLRAWIAANQESPQRKAFLNQARALCQAFETPPSFNPKEAAIGGDNFFMLIASYVAMIEAEKVEAERGEGMDACACCGNQATHTGNDGHRRCDEHRLNE